ncbi:MAG: hypothetical protein ABI744_02795 [Chloroflexota bacterium]
MSRLITRLYPRAWRERYGTELSDLIDETGMSGRVAFDVARGASQEWTSQARLALAGGGSMVIGPAWRHPTAWAVVGAVVLLPTVLFIALSALAISNPFGDQFTSQRYLDLALLLAPALAALLAALPLVRVSYTPADGGPVATLSVRLRAVNMVVVITGLGITCLLVGHVLFESVLRLGA